MPDETVRVTELPFNCFNASFSPDGNFLAVATRLGVAVFNARSHVKVGETNLGSAPLWCSPILFSADKREVSYVNRDFNFVKTEISRQACSMPLFLNETPKVFVATLLSGDRVLVCLESGVVAVRDIRGNTQRLFRSQYPSTIFGGGPSHVAVSPDEQWVALCHVNDCLEIFSTKGIAPIRVEGAIAPRTAVFVDSNTLVVGASAGEIYRVDLTDGQPQVHKLFKCAKRCVTLTPLDDAVWSFSLDGCCRLISILGDVRRTVVLDKRYGDFGFGRVNPAGTAAFVAPVEGLVANGTGLLVDFDHRPMAVSFKQAIAAGDEVAAAQYADWAQDN